MPERLYPAPADATAMPDGTRVRHALRVGLGGCVLALLSETGATSGCVSSVLFYISSIAGTPENFQGFVLRSALNTTYGALLAGGLFLAIVHAASFNHTVAFFLFLPLAAFLAALRTDRALLPLPLVAIVLLGYFLISFIDKPPAAANAAAKTLLYDSLLALAITFITQALLPDLAAASAARTLAAQARAAGAALSAASSRLLSVACSPAAPQTATAADPVLDSLSYSRRENADWETVTPPGRRRVAEYTALARARQLLAAAAYEPGRGFGRGRGGGEKLLVAMETLITKVASIESAAFVADCRGAGAHFSKEYLVLMLGEELLPVWMEHFAASAAACAGVSDRLERGGGGRIEAAVDAGSAPWLDRRARMYAGFTEQYRKYWRRRGILTRAGAAPPDESIDEMLGAADGDLGGDGGEGGGREPAVVRGSELRSILFIAVTSHAMSEALATVQAEAVVAAGRDSFWRGVTEPLRILWIPVPPAVRCTCAVLRLRLAPWEVRFVVTHVALLAAILAVIVFVDALDEFQAAQLAWVYASAGLAAQLSLESTLFIGVLRLAATVAGCAAAYGVNRAIRSAGTSGALFALGPYFGAITVGALLLLPPKFRYASFLFIVTNALVSFCPRETNECVAAVSVIDDACFPGRNYALTRGINVGIGVVLAIMFHSVLWPRFAQDSARRCLAEVYGNGTDLFAAVHRKYREMGDAAEAAETSIDENREQSMVHAAVDDDNADDDAVEDAATHGHVTRPSDYRILIDDLDSQEVMRAVGVKELTVTAQRYVREPLERALLLLKADASAWTMGRLALPDVLNELPEHFVSLSVAMSEMASMLGRRPVLSGHYHSTAHAMFIIPLAYEHETLLVSLFHLGEVLHKLLTLRDEPRALASLQCASRHLRHTLRNIHKRVAELRRNMHNRRLVEAPRDDDVGDGRGGGVRKCQSTGNLATTCSNDTEWERDGLPHVDDIVLYNAFSFSSNACVAAFLSIADVCERSIADLLQRRRSLLRKKA